MGSFDSAGLVVDRLADIRQNARDYIDGSSEFGSGTPTGPETPIGQTIDVTAVPLDKDNELLQEVYDSFNPDNAEGVQLENLSGLTGVVRQPATRSTVTLTLSGTPTTVVAAGKRSRIPNGTLWQLTEEVTIGGAPTDGPAESVDTGPIEASPGSIDEIVDAVAGWTGVTNAAVADEGTNVETDTALRARRERSLSVGGSSRDAAIRARLEQLDFVTAAAAISNRTLTADSKGIPGKACRSVILPSGLSDAQKALVGEALWEIWPSGIYSDGADVVVTITDDRGYPQVMRASYGTQLEVYADFKYTPGASFPATGEADIKQACEDFDDDLSLGDDVKPLDLEAFIRSQVPGIDHLETLIKFGAPPGGGDSVPLSVDSDEFANFDVANITVAVL